MKRWALRILLFLLLGAIVNITVAWGLALWTDARRGLISGPDLSRVVFPQYEGGDIPAGTDVGLWGEYVGLRVSERLCTQPLVYVRDVSAGWPALALSGALVNNNYSMGVLKAPEPSSGVYGREQLIPLRPILPGFAINTVLYAAILWVLFAAPFALRRRLRRKRGLCPACGYRVGESPVCTECGTPHTVTPKAVTT